MNSDPPFDPTVTMGEPPPAVDGSFPALAQDPERTATMDGTAKGNPPASPAGLPFTPGYRLEEEIGRGASGVVWRALQEGTERKVAVKMLLLRDDPRQTERLKRFGKEIRLAADLKHINIAQIHAGGAESGFYAMELVTGLPLDRHAEASGLNLRARVEMMVKVCQAVQMAHERGIVHGDLKPSNVLVSSHDQEPKVLDFGLARLAGEDDTGASGSPNTIGTPLYMPPEMVTLGAAGTGTPGDVYSLGVMLYHLVTGRFPHEPGTSEAETLQRIATRPCSPPHEADPELAAILTKALAPAPGRRYASAGLLGEDLDRFWGNKPVAALDWTPAYVLRKWFSRNRRRVAVLSILLLAITAASVGWIRTLESRREALAERIKRNQAEAAAFVQEGLEAGRNQRVGEMMAWFSAALRASPHDRATAAFLEDTIRKSRWALPAVSPLSAGAALTVDSSGGLLAALDSHGQVLVWEAASGRIIRRLPVPSEESVTHLLLAGGKETEIALFTKSGKPSGPSLLRLYSLNDGSEILTRELPAPLRSAVRDASGRCLLLTSRENDVECAYLDSRTVYSILSGDGDDLAGLWGPLAVKGDFSTSFTAIHLSDGRFFVARANSGHLAAGVIFHPGKSPALALRMDSAAVAADFSPDGALLATGHADGSVKLWSTSDGSVAAELRHTGDGKPQSPAPPDRHYVLHCAFSPDGRWLLASGVDGGQISTCIWNAANGELLQTLAHGNLDPVLSISPDSQRLAVGLKDGTVRVHDLPGGQAVCGPWQTGGAVTSLLWADGGRLLAAQTSGGGMDLRRIIEGSPPPLRTTGDSPVTDACFNPAGDLFAIGRGDGRVEILSSGDGSLRTRLGLAPSIRSLRFHPSRPTLAVLGGDNRTLRLWDYSKPDSVPTPLHLPAAPNSLREKMEKVAPTGMKDDLALDFSPDGGMLSVAGAGLPFVRLYSIDHPGAPPLSARVDLMNHLGAGWSPQGGLFATASLVTDGLSLWKPDFTSGRVEKAGAFRGSLPTQTVLLFAFHPRRPLLLTVSLDLSLQMRELPGLKPAANPLSLPSPALFCGFSPEGDTFATASRDGSLRIWDSGSLRLRCPAILHDQAIRVACYSPDGRRVATASDDGIARIWDAATGRQLSAPMRHEGYVTHLEFNRAGDLLLTSSTDGACRIWKTPAPHDRTPEEIGELCRLAGELCGWKPGPDGIPKPCPVITATAFQERSRSGKP